MKKPEDPFAEFAGRQGCLVLAFPVDADVCQEVGARLDERTCGSFKILRAIGYPELGIVQLAYWTTDQKILELFAGPGMTGRFPMDLSMQIQLTTSAVRGERDEQAERSRKERDEQNFARHHEELQRLGVLFPDGPARREALRRVN